MAVHTELEQPHLREVGGRQIRFSPDRFSKRRPLSKAHEYSPSIAKTSETVDFGDRESKRFRDCRICRFAERRALRRSGPVQFQRSATKRKNLRLFSSAKQPP